MTEQEHELSIAGRFEATPEYVFLPGSLGCQLCEK